MRGGGPLPAVRVGVIGLAAVSLALAVQPASAEQLASASSATLSALPATLELGQPDLKDPWVAAGLSLGLPALWAGLTYGGIQLYGNSSSPSLAWAGATTAYVLAPVSVGAGQFYAGDPLRGTLVGLGAYAVGAAAILASGVFGDTGHSYPPGVGPSTEQQALTVVSLVGLPLVYCLWSGYDAYQTAVRKDHEATAADGPRHRSHPARVTPPGKRGWCPQPSFGLP